MASYNQTNITIDDTDQMHYSMFDSQTPFLTPLAIQTGLACLAAQCILTVFFAYIPTKGPWKDMPGFTAHQVVAFFLWVYMAYLGITAWYFDDSNIFDTPTDRTLKLHPAGIELSEIAIGMQLFWKTPICFIIPTLHDNVMLLHHIGMLISAGLLGGKFGRAVGSYHAIFYMGVLEVSSIPLVFIDLTNHKRKPWLNYLKEQDSSSFLHLLNEVCRVTFALSFLTVRVCLFLYNAFTFNVPDLLHVATLPDEERYGVSRATLYTLIVLIVSFLSLQLFWSLKVIRNVQNTLAKKRKSKKE